MLHGRVTALCPGGGGFFFFFEFWVELRLPGDGTLPVLPTVSRADQIMRSKSSGSLPFRAAPEPIKCLIGNKLLSVGEKERESESERW